MLQAALFVQLSFTANSGFYSAGDRMPGFATLGKAKQVDPTYKRTILIRNKLDK